MILTKDMLIKDTDFPYRIKMIIGRRAPVGCNKTYYELTVEDLCSLETKDFVEERPKPTKPYEFYKLPIQYETYKYIVDELHKNGLKLKREYEYNGWAEFTKYDKNTSFYENWEV